MKIFIIALMLPAVLCGAAEMQFPPDIIYPKPALDQITSASGIPNAQLEVHKVNKLGLAVTNNGNIGTGYYWYHAIDPETGYRAPSCEYPINSYSEYLSVGVFGLALSSDMILWFPPMLPCTRMSAGLNCGPTSVRPVEAIRLGK